MTIGAEVLLVVVMLACTGLGALVTYVLEEVRHGPPSDP